MKGCGGYSYRLESGGEGLFRRAVKLFSVLPFSPPPHWFGQTITLASSVSGSSTYLCAVYSSTLMAEAAGSFELPVHLCQTTQCHIPVQNSYSRETLRPHLLDHFYGLQLWVMWNLRFVLLFMKIKVINLE
jgi:hypothetical protein